MGIYRVLEKKKLDLPLSSFWSAKQSPGPDKTGTKTQEKQPMANPQRNP